MISETITDLIGNTPLVRLNRLSRDLSSSILVKLESKNPGGSIKDRIALSMIEAAEHQGLITPGVSTIVEPTSGNTGIGLALVGAARNYRVVIVMPDSLSRERMDLLRLLGADLVLTPGASGIEAAIEEASRIRDETPNAYMPLQFENPENPAAHRRTTAEEIYRDTEGSVDVFVAGVGTGGTITGTGSRLKELIGDCRVVAVEPAGSPVISGGKPGPHGIQGIGAGFIPQVLDLTVIDEIITVTDQDALTTARRIITEEGILCGISSGANVWAARKLAARPEYTGKTIVTIICDTGDRYLSTDLAKSTNE
ncbi:MAG: cysteine synthase A [Deltaproteobacteria bacterium]|nr:cysteine synthase A [Candidatus Zymogenaceae bacterium]